MALLDPLGDPGCSIPRGRAPPAGLVTERDEARTAMAKKTLLAGAALASALAYGAARAQSLQGTLSQGQGQTFSNFARDQAVSVTQRPHPGYDPVGVGVGGFTLFPKLTANGEYNDNIFATTENQVADGISQITPEIDLASNWSRHSLFVYARGTFSQYWQNSNQNTDDFAVGARGQLDVLRTARINAGVALARVTESRTAATSEGVTFPIQSNDTSIYLSATKEFDRLRLSARADWLRFRYIETPGNPSQADRDRDLTIGTVRADYAVSPDTALFVEVAANDRSYRLSSSPIVNGVPEFPGFMNRDSHGVQLLAGANFQLGTLVRGELGFGYLTQHYKDSSFADVNGPGARVQFEWFPSELTTFTFTGSQSVEDAGIVGAASYLSTNIGLQVDHELLRNLVLTANLSHGKDDYRGIDRQDKRFIAGFGATYKMNHAVAWTLGYNHYKQDSTGADASVLASKFTVNRFDLTLTLQY
jgi:hypothetical protein